MTDLLNTIEVLNLIQPIIKVDEKCYTTNDDVCMHYVYTNDIRCKPILMQSNFLKIRISNLNNEPSNKHFQNKLSTDELYQKYKKRRYYQRSDDIYNIALYNEPQYIEHNFLITYNRNFNKLETLSIIYDCIQADYQGGLLFINNIINKLNRDDLNVKYISTMLDQLNNGILIKNKYEIIVDNAIFLDIAGNEYYFTKIKKDKFQLNINFVNTRTIHKTIKLKCNLKTELQNHFA